MVKPRQCSFAFAMIIPLFTIILHAQNPNSFHGQWDGAMINDEEVFTVTLTIYNDGKLTKGLIDYPAFKNYNIESSILTRNDSLFVQRISKNDNKIIGVFIGLVKNDTYTGFYKNTKGDCWPFVFALRKIPLIKGEKVTDFSVTSLDSLRTPLSFNEVKGKYLLVDFWATYCKTCIPKRTELDSIYKKYPGQLEILSISLDKERAAVNRFQREKFAMPWKNGFVANDFNCPTCKLFGVDLVGTPSLFLISPEGKLLAKTNELLDMGIDNVIKSFINPVQR